MDYLRDDPLNKEFVDKIDAFLQGDEIDYLIYYDNPEDDDFYEAPFDATKNDMRIKFFYIELLYPSDGIDEKALMKRVIHFCKKKPWNHSKIFRKLMEEISQMS